MSVFQSFQTGLALGKQQKRDRDMAEARKSAGDLFKSGNYEGAETLLMSSGLMDEASAYASAGSRRKAAEDREALGRAYKEGGWEGVSSAAGERGDLQTVATAQTAEHAGKTREWEARNQQIMEHKQGVEFLATEAGRLKAMPLEQRGAAAMQAIENSPFAGNPEIIAAIERAAADGKIDDNELTAFQEQMLTYAQKLDIEYRDKTFENTLSQQEQAQANWEAGHALDQRKTAAAEQAAVAKANGVRQMTPEEVKAAGYPEGTIVQIDAAGKHQVRHKPGAEFSAGQQNKFRNDYVQLKNFRDTLSKYKAAVAEGGLDAVNVFGNDEQNATLKALKQDLLFQGKNLWELGVLSKDDYENMEKAIPSATGLGAKVGGRKSFNAKIDILDQSIGNRISYIPDEFRAAPEGMTAPDDAGGGDAIEFEDADSIPEGAVVEDENGQRFRKVSGQLVAVQ